MYDALILYLSLKDTAEYSIHENEFCSALKVFGGAQTGKSEPLYIFVEGVLGCIFRR